MFRLAARDAHAHHDRAGLHRRQVIATILFEGTMDGEVQGKPTPAFLWEDRGVVPFVKVDGDTARQTFAVDQRVDFAALRRG